MPNVDLIPRKQPQQARSGITIQRVLEEAELLLVEQGMDGFNINVLAQRAGVGVRAIYRYFPNIERSWTR